MSDSDRIVLIVIIIIVVVVVCIALFRKPSTLPDTAPPIGTGNQCSYNTDCPSGMFCRSAVNSAGQMQTSFCSPFCMEAFPYNGVPTDTCTQFVTQTAACTPSADQFSRYCALKPCSSGNAGCASTEVCVPSTTADLTSGFCYPDPTKNPDPVMAFGNQQPSRSICDPTNPATGGFCYGNPNILCKPVSQGGTTVNTCVVQNPIQ